MKQFWFYTGWGCGLITINQQLRIVKPTAPIFAKLRGQSINTVLANSDYTYKLEEIKEMKSETEIRRIVNLIKKYPLHINNTIDYIVYRNTIDILHFVLEEKSGFEILIQELDKKEIQDATNNPTNS